MGKLTLKEAKNILNYEAYSQRDSIGQEAYRTGVTCIGLIEYVASLKKTYPDSAALMDIYSEIERCDIKITI